MSEIKKDKTWIDTLFESQEVMIFKDRKTGTLIKTHNMFYLMYDSLYEYIGTGDL